MPRRHALLILVVLATGAAACSHATAPPTPAHREVQVTHGAIAFVPDAPAAQRVALADELSGFLHKLYTEGFVRRRATGPTPEPDDAPTRRIAALFAPGARTKLEQQPSVFTLGPHLDLLAGHVSYQGGITRDGSITTALISLTFAGNGSRIDEGTPVVTVLQSGQLTLQHSESGWFVRAFDLKISLAPPPPTPSPS
jgi:hypothetical protein